jgi:ABC-2 type transport system ATP-binding protein
MKDVVALCRRVVIIAKGRIVHDGSLTEIIDRFSRHKVITLQFASDDLPEDLARYGEVIELEAPRAKLRVERRVVTEILSAILQKHPIRDVSVEDPPLEEVLAKMFAVSEKDTAYQSVSAVVD